MSRADNSKKGKSFDRQGGDHKKRSGRQGGQPKKVSYSRGNAPIQKQHKSKKTQMSPDQIRLNKYIANSGICSRRDADIYIASGNVTVNGEVITEMGYRVELNDVVKFDGRAINPEKKVYILLNKPKGFLTTTSDEKGRKTVMDLVAKATKARIVPVGRLERSTTGLLLFTNDGDLSKKLTNSGRDVRKIYQVTLNKSFQIKDLHAIREGLTLEDGIVKVDEISTIEGANKNEVGIKIHSNKNKIVRRIFEHLDYEVIKLDRVVFAGLTKKDLPRGTWRHLTKQEVINLQML
ncbi:ribosomal large subunit pseudouridine synthase B [Galbibacter marinus]|uniref:Ribosomal large subunit pseudouridine synthase B n=1 Tax=Galbibacter marinus TaxID=555500 RepID=K2PRS9_9FLAO|nr:pseudouridine synthase [Galbibacter marinus]EKF54214.1 ribosomal large subunit pseudouridine synthase B [Galbibacter marinus]